LRNVIPNKFKILRDVIIWYNKQIQNKWKRIFSIWDLLEDRRDNKLWISKSRRIFPHNPLQQSCLSWSLWFCQLFDNFYCRKSEIKHSNEQILVTQRKNKMNEINREWFWIDEMNLSVWFCWNEWVNVRRVQYWNENTNEEFYASNPNKISNMSKTNTILYFNFFYGRSTRILHQHHSTSSNDNWEKNKKNSQVINQKEKRTLTSKMKIPPRVTVQIVWSTKIGGDKIFCPPTKQKYWNKVMNDK
jgi:hypothetical protein